MRAVTYLHDGPLSTFDVPGDVLNSWDAQDLVETIKDMDQQSGRAILDSLRIDPPASGQINRYKVP